MSVSPWLLVKKSYMEKRRKKRAAGASRAWKLQRMEMQNAEEGNNRGGRGNAEADKVGRCRLPISNAELKAHLV